VSRHSRLDFAIFARHDLELGRGGFLMERNQMNRADCLKAQIYEDFLSSIASVRAGRNPDAAFRDHEARVYRLRMEVAAVEAGHMRHASEISMVA
jgi:hypothetical protein